MNAFRGVGEWLSGPIAQRRGVRILQFVVGVVTLSRLFTEVPFALYLWGPRGIGYGSTSFILGDTCGGWADAAFTTVWGTYAIVGAMGVGAFALMVGRCSWAATALVLVTTFLVESRLPELGDGGDNIRRLTLIYMLFLAPQGVNAPAGSYRAWIHNLAVVAIIAQLMVLYFVSGFMKAAGPLWHHGTALYGISQVEWFSHPDYRWIFRNSVIVTFSTYMAVVFQIWFPIAMFSRFKLVWIAIGATMHLGIAVLMGLVHFSAMMIGLELFTLTDGEWGKIGNGWQRFRQSVSKQLLMFRRKQPSHALYFDGFCPKCRAIAARLRWLDWRGHLQLRSFRDDRSFDAFGITSAQVEERMHLVSLHSGSSVSGYAAICGLARLLPLLWPVVPVLTIGAIGGFGNRCYDAYARRRNLDGGSCTDQFCSREPGTDA